MDKIKVLLVPFGAIVAIVGIFVLVMQFVAGRISPLTTDLNTSQNQQSMLSSKVATLTQVNQEHLNQSEAAYLALPDRNPAALVISQIKDIALANNLRITSISVSSSTSETELSNAIIELKAEGAQDGVFEFLKSLENLSPLVSIQESKITTLTTNETELQLNLNSYWASFPEKLPTLTEAVSGLSDDEVNILSQLSSLTKPSFSELTPVESEPGRVNPFATE